MRVLICGDRNWRDRSLIQMAIYRLKQVDCVIEGEARGADRLAREVAEAAQIPVLPFPADWSQGRSAGPIRNRRMLKEGYPDLVIAFHDSLETSRGTKNMVSLALKARIPVLHYSHQGMEELTS